MGTNDPAVSATAYRHGNYDVVTGDIVWCSTNTDHSIPASLLYRHKPSWFGDRPWPPFDPAYGALIASNLMAHTNIPAGYRFVYGVDPPADHPPVGRPFALANFRAILAGQGLAVAFSSAGSYSPRGAALSYLWTFGDGTLSTAPNPSHSYSSSGTYKAQVTVSDGLSKTLSSPLTVTVTNGEGN
jgi:PKD repeat protein